MRRSANRIRHIRFWNTVILCVLFQSHHCLAENPDSTYRNVAERVQLIRQVADLFGVNPAYLSAIIYTERTLNFDWRDTKFDVALFEELGLNSSIGFCQIKIKTAYYIERQFATTGEPYYPGDAFTELLTVSRSRKELLERMVQDSLNICYAAAYLRMMQSRWANAKFSIDSRPDILGTLYSTGLYHEDGSERMPNATPQSNSFGKRVKDAVTLFLPMFEKES